MYDLLRSELKLSNKLGIDETHLQVHKEPGKLNTSKSYNEWPYLITFLDHPEIPISNILVENAIRPFAIGRKNWLSQSTLTQRTISKTPSLYILRKV